MIEPLIHSEGLSPKRHDLCSRTHAQRLAGRLMNAFGRPMTVIRTSNPLQPFRVSDSDADQGKVVLEVRT